MIKIAWSVCMVLCAVTTVAHAAGTTISISPAESLVRISPAHNSVQQVTLSRRDADTQKTYTVSAEVGEGLTGVEVEAEDLVFLQGEEEKIYSYTVRCAQNCSGSGVITVRFTPRTESVPTEGIISELGVAHTVRMTVVSLDDAIVPTVGASTIPDIASAVHIESITPHNRFIDPGKTLEVSIVLTNTLPTHIQYMPYTVDIYRSGARILSEQGTFSETLPSNASVNILWTRVMDQRGDDTVVFTIAGHEERFVVYVSTTQHIVFWIVFLVVAATALFYIRFFVRHSLRARVQQNGSLRRRGYRLLWYGLALSGVAGACLVGVWRVPHLEKNMDWSVVSADEPAFILVHDAQEYTMIRLSDGKTDHLTGQWNFFSVENTYMYAVPVAGDPNTTSRHFFRISPSSIQQYSTEQFSGQITSVSENTPGTYAIAQGDRFFCIFKTQDAEAPHCLDTSSLIAVTDSVSAEWVGSAGEYVDLYITHLDGSTDYVQYDVWNTHVEQLTVPSVVTSHEYTQNTPLVFSVAQPVWKRFCVQVFGQCVRSPWNTRVAEVNNTLAVILYPDHSGYTFALLNADKKYTPILSVSSDAEVYLLKKGMVTTSPVISER